MPMKPGRPTAKLTLDGQSLTAVEAGVLGLSLRRAHGTHDTLLLSLWPRSKFADAAPGATLAVALGTDDSNEDVFAGEVSGLRTSPSALRIEAHSATVALSRERKSATYRDQTVADIVQDLASPVGVDEAKSDLKLSAYSVDHRRSVWSHLLDLAVLAGAEISVAADGTLRFVPKGTRADSHTFHHGATLLTWDLHTRASPPVLTVVASGSASAQGAERWHWLAHDPLGENPEPSWLVGAFHTRDAADALARSLKQDADRASIQGTLRVVGTPTLRPGDQIQLEDLPGDASGTFRVRIVHHTFHPRVGFVTDATVEGAGDSGGFGP